MDLHVYLKRVFILFWEFFSVKSKCVADMSKQF